MSKHRIRCGDAVLHKPTGETLLVAYADYETGDFSWSGWPDGIGRISDCEIKRIATDSEHAEHVAQWLASGAASEAFGFGMQRDHRARAVRRLYGEVAS